MLPSYPRPRPLPHLVISNCFNLRRTGDPKCLSLLCFLLFENLVTKNKLSRVIPKDLLPQPGNTIGHIEGRPDPPTRMPCPRGFYLHMHLSFLSHFYSGGKCYISLLDFLINTKVHENSPDLRAASNCQHLADTATKSVINRSHTI